MKAGGEKIYQAMQIVRIDLFSGDWMLESCDRKFQARATTQDRALQALNKMLEGQCNRGHGTFEGIEATAASCQKVGKPVVTVIDKPSLFARLLKRLGL